MLAGRPPVGVGGMGILAALVSDGELPTEAFPGSGGRGIAGGGDGREATDALLRRFCDIELDLLALAASSGAISSNLACILLAFSHVDIPMIIVPGGAHIPLL